jgi:hypothetical protein
VHEVEIYNRTKSLKPGRGVGYKEITSRTGTKRLGKSVIRTVECRPVARQKPVNSNGEVMFSGGPCRDAISRTGSEE